MGEEVKETNVNPSEIIGTEQSLTLTPPRTKTRTLIRNLTKETIGNETSQALIRIFETKYLGLKVFWPIFLLVCGTLCAYLVAQTVIAYLSFSVPLRQ